MKFQIKSISGKPIKEGDTFVRYTGNSEPFAHGDEMGTVKLGVLPDGTPKLKFRTGLDEKDIQNYGWFNEEEKKSFMEFLKEHRPIIANHCGGEEVIDSTNQFFWKEDGERNKIKITNDTLNIVYDTKNPDHCLLYINIMGGAFLEAVAPTKEMAENPRTQIPHYVEIESNFNDDDVDDYMTKAEAYGLLTELKNDSEGDALLYIAWCLNNNTKSFGAFTRSSSKTDILKYHAEYIEGKLTKVGKRTSPKDFMDYANKWKTSGLTRNKLMVEAYLKGADYYSYLNTNRENKYELPSGVILGLTIPDAVVTILKPRNTLELDSLRNFVENKWKE